MSAPNPTLFRCASKKTRHFSYRVLRLQENCNVTLVHVYVRRFAVKVLIAGHSKPLERPVTKLCLLIRHDVEEAPTK